MPIPYDDADQIFRTVKQLLRPHRWVALDRGVKENARASYEVRISCDLAVPRGVFFRIVAHAGSLTRITFQLECERPERRSRVTLYRFELNPPNPHLNKMWGPTDIAGLRIEAGTPHEHIFYDGVKQDGSLRERPDAQGRIVNNPPHDFATAVAYVCSRINVINGSDVPVPNKQGQLL